MNLTQSTVSVLLRQLEQGPGIALFDRTTRVLAPTAAGRQTLPFAERALREIEQLQATTHDLLTKSSGCVRLATSAAIAASVLPQVLTTFKAAHPAIEIDLRDMAPSELNRSLLEREVDFAVGAGQTPSRQN